MSIKSIAKKTGASPATVSRVLNNPDYKCRVPGLRDEIWKAAMEENYAPNEAARNLKKGIKGDYAVRRIDVLMARAESDHADPFFSELLRIVESETHRTGCILTNVWYRSLFSDDRRCMSENLDRVINEFAGDQQSRSDGLIIIGRCNKKALEKLCKAYRGNAVSINRNPTNYEVDEVICDGRKIAAMAVEYLISLGHRGIAYIGTCKGEARYRGYQDVLARHGIDVLPDFVVETNQTELEGFNAMEKFLREDEQPTGIYCANDITALGVLKCLKKYKKLSYVPSVIASDDIEESQNIKPMLTTVRLPRDEMGRFAVSLLRDRIEGGHESVVRIELQGKLMVRESCGKV